MVTILSIITTFFLKEGNKIHKKQTRVKNKIFLLSDGESKFRQDLIWKCLLRINCCQFSSSSGGKSFTIFWSITLILLHDIY